MQKKQAPQKVWKGSIYKKERVSQALLETRIGQVFSRIKEKKMINIEEVKRVGSKRELRLEINSRIHKLQTNMADEKFLTKPLDLDEVRQIFNTVDDIKSLLSALVMMPDAADIEEDEEPVFANNGKLIR